MPLWLGSLPKSGNLTACHVHHEVQLEAVEMLGKIHATISLPDGSELEREELATHSAYEMYERDGVLLRYIFRRSEVPEGAVLVSHSYKYAEVPETAWHHGLTARTRNLLLQAGFSSKDQVIEALSKGELRIHKGSTLYRESEIYGFGRKSFAELRSWCCMPAEGEDQGEPPSKAEIDKAIVLLVRNGFVVNKQI